METQKHEIKLFDIINNYRKHENLDGLRYDDAISNVARKHSFDMATGRVAFGHDGFEDRVKNLSGNQALKISENVASFQGHPINEEIIAQFWLKSESHLKIIRGDYQTTGIGIAKGKSNKYFITQLFVQQ